MTKLNTVVLLLMMTLLRLSRCLKLPGAQENSARTMVTDLIKRKSRDREGLGKPKGAMLPKYELLRHQLSGLPSSRPFLVLGIETSCDDTGVAVVSSNGSVLANVVYSQYEIHERFGGVVPSLAMESHKANVDKAIAKALETAGMQSLNDIDAVAVTRGPGLEICLRVGCRRAQSIALEYRKPFVTVHHLEAHCLIARLAGVEVSNESSETRPVVLDPIDSGVKEFQPKVEFPFLVFLASGGHTSLMLCHGLGDFRQLGGTLDDALGEAFDKAARLLGLKLSGSGGAAVEALARSGNPDTYRSFLRVPMRDRIDCDFSYAGMKSSFRLAVVAARAAAGITDESKLRSSNAPANQMEESPEPVELPSEAAADLCAAFQDVAFQHVEDRLHRALDYVEDNGVPVTALVVVGGVAANLELRRRLLRLLRSRQTGEDVPVLPLVFPPVSLCTDNGVMAAWGGVEKLLEGISDSAEDQEVQARWPLGTAMSPTFRRRPTRKEREGEGKDRGGRTVHSKDFTSRSE